MTVLVTGGTGFIGRRLVATLLERDARVKVLVRQSTSGDFSSSWSTGKVTSVVADLADTPSLNYACKDVDTVFHLAGYAHTDDANDDGSAAIHWRVTVEGTRALLQEAARGGVERFVFASSVKAMGEGGDRELDETYTPEPVTAYGRAKLAAEQLVLEAGEHTGMHACVLRLPLVYGVAVKGNLRRMIAAIDRARFPPIPEVANRRSMVHVDDVVQALLAATTQKACGRIYLVTDGQVYSTREIYDLIRRALGKNPPNWTVPLRLLRAAGMGGDILGRLTGRKMPIDSVLLSKLLESACYSNMAIQRELDFRPRYSFENALPEMIDEYRTPGARA